MENWKAKYEEAERAFHRLKAHTKSIPAGSWSTDYRELAELIHTLGREVFPVPEPEPQKGLTKI